MNRQAATEYVIRELGKHHQRNDIIQGLCETEGMSWQAAEKFIQQVEAENTGKIALRQSPMVTLIGLGIAIGGLGLMIAMVTLTLNGVIISFLSLPVPYLGNVFYFFTGLAMMIGGISGMWDTILRIWNS